MFKYLALSTCLALSLSACTTVDPYTGQAGVDQARTAALLGSLALVGAAAYANNQKDDDQQDNYRHSQVYHPKKGVDCYDADRRCYRNNGKYSKKWTQRVYHQTQEQGYSRYP